MKTISRSHVVGGLLTAAVIAAAVVGLFILGSPAEERARWSDAHRVADLDELARIVDLYWTRHERLPASLEELRREPGSNLLVFTDPATNDPYEYRSLRADVYELCALDSNGIRRGTVRRPAAVSGRTPPAGNVFNARLARFTDPDLRPQRP